MQGEFNVDKYFLMNNIMGLIKEPESNCLPNKKQTPSISKAKPPFVDKVSDKVHHLISELVLC